VQSDQWRQARAVAPIRCALNGTEDGLDVDALHAIARALADERDRRRVAVSREADESTVDSSDWLRLVESDGWPWPDDTPPEDANRPG
jgi:hypothetical protein